MLDEEEDDAEQLTYDAAIAMLDESYELVVPSYDDQLDDAQVAMLVRGEWGNLWESLDEWESDTRHYSVDCIIQETFGERFDDLDFDEQQAVRDEIHERDTGEWFTRIARNSPDVLVAIGMVFDGYDPAPDVAVRLLPPLRSVGSDDVREACEWLREQMNGDASGADDGLFLVACADLSMLANAAEGALLEMHSPGLLAKSYDNHSWWDTESTVVFRRDRLQPFSDIVGADLSAFAASVVPLRSAQDVLHEQQSMMTELEG